MVYAALRWGRDKGGTGQTYIMFTSRVAPHSNLAAPASWGLLDVLSYWDGGLSCAGGAC